MNQTNKPKFTNYSLDFRELNWALQQQEPDTYALGLTDTGLAVTHPTLATPPVLISADSDLDTWALTRTIVTTTKMDFSHTIGLYAYIFSRRPQLWDRLFRTSLYVPLQQIEQVLSDIPDPCSPGKIVVIFDNIGPDWNLPYQYISWVSKMPRVHLVASASPEYALKIRPLFQKIIVGHIADTETRNTLTKPHKFDEHLDPGQFIFHQRGWKRFFSLRILKSET